MRCLYPIRLKRAEGYEDVPCGHCVVCQGKYKDDWALRVKHELTQHRQSVFLTLTYNDVHLSLQNLEYQDGTINSLQKRELQLFMKNLRRDIEPLQVRFFACGEYGEKFGRPHYHILIFGLGNDHPVFDNKRPYYKNGILKHFYIEKLDSWPHGQVEISANEPDEKGALYISKYVAKKKGQSDPDFYKIRHKNPEFLLMSRKPGLGYFGIKEHSKYYLSNSFGRVGKRKVSLSRYMKEKIADFTNTDFKELCQINQKAAEKLTKNQIQQIERNINAKNKGL